MQILNILARAQIEGGTGGTRHPQILIHLDPSPSLLWREKSRNAKKCEKKCEIAPLWTRMGYVARNGITLLYSVVELGRLRRLKPGYHSYPERI